MKNNSDIIAADHNNSTSIRKELCNRENFKVKLFFLLSLSFSLLSSLIPASSPQAAGGLVVTPQLVELDSRNRSTVLTLANRGDKPETYRISVINYRMDDQGNLFPTGTPAADEGFAEGLFRYAPRQVTLEPGKPQTVRILYRRPATLAEGEYRSHLLFQQVPEALPQAASSSTQAGLSVEIKTIFGITIPVLVRHGQLESQGQLTNIQPSQHNGEKNISLRIARSGKQSLRGDLVALAGRTEVGRLNNVAVYLSTPYRDVVMPLQQDKLSVAPGQDILIEYRPRGDDKAPVIATGKAIIN
ncbi:fimbrial biogenesis chaperone [Kiloniella laminariae]|uniref:fimbrial biogenesis chaperone n=1 Tax=Kiloniella laminariae TaxID=454162 RepID=UPI000364660A|nr:fimbria/pilus periplasmic chaperone [Kiloniella laminariae]